MKNDFIIVVTEYAAIGSGYTSIAKKLIPMLNELYDADIVVLGLSYKNEEHDEQARIVAAQSFSDIPVMLHNIVLSGASVRAIIVALDIPLQVKIIEWIDSNDKVPIRDIPYIGIFPLESPPLSLMWANSIGKMSAAFALTDFAVQEMAKHDIEASRFPLSIDTGFWRPAAEDERSSARHKYGIGDDTFMVLVVGDNQERKNLSAAVEGFAGFVLDTGTIEYDKRGYVLNAKPKHSDAVMHIVTRVDSPFGWEFTDLLFRNGVMAEVVLHERGLNNMELRELYYAADVMLSTSKAEGLGIPILEAIACGLPVIGVDCAATHEHLHGANGGVLMQPDYVMTDPFGNELRYLVHPQTVTNSLEAVYNDRTIALADRRYIFEKSKSHNFVKLLKAAIDGAEKAKE